jgi:hypothetical protein
MSSMHQATLESLPSAWRSRAAELRAYGAEPQAITLERAAEELEAAAAAHANSLLTLADAVVESGYSTASLRRMVVEGNLPDRGGRYRRGDLPRKPGYGVTPTAALPATPPLPADQGAVLAAPPRRTSLSNRQAARSIAMGE